MADGEKTEPATPKKREDAREQGDVASSREIPTIFVLIVMLIATGSSIGENLVQAVAIQGRDVWSGAELHPIRMADFHAVLLHHARLTGGALAPILCLILLSGVASYLIQTGPMWATKALGVKLNRINLLKGMKRLVDKNKLFELGKAFIKIGLVAGAAWLTLRSDMAGIYALVDASIWNAMIVGGEMAVRLAMAAIVLLSFVAAADVLWVQYRHEEKLKMTKQEVRDERKQREGDPQIKNRMRQMARDLTRQRMIQDVAEADVVVTNPTHFSVALQYLHGKTGAPKVIAKGRGYVALRIREEARKHGVPLVENKPLAQVLYRTVQVGREVPENLYQAVAEILAYVYRLRPERQHRHAAHAGAA